MQIKAAVVREPHGRFGIETAELDSPRDDEVRVELVATGICHTDLAIVEQLVPLPLPFVLGHEGAGVVVETGRGVTGLAKGDHVVLAFGSCGKCRDCSSGHPAYCESFPMLNFAGRRADGSATIEDSSGAPLNAAFFSQSSFATQAIAPARNAIKVSKHAPLRLLGPLGCGFMTGAGTVLNVLKPRPDSTFAIFGTGALGFAALLAAKISGCRRIIAVDRVQTRLDLARDLGASDVIDTSRVNLGEALTALGGIDRAIDTTGVPKVIEAAVAALNRCGELALVGASSRAVDHARDDSDHFGPRDPRRHRRRCRPAAVHSVPGRALPRERVSDRPAGGLLSVRADQRCCRRRARRQDRQAHRGVLSRESQNREPKPSCRPARSSRISSEPPPIAITRTSR